MDPLALINLLLVLVALAFPFYENFLQPTAKVTVSRSPHWTSGEKDEALHEFVLKNEGNAPAKGLGIHFELPSKFKIINVTSDKEWIKSRQIGGENESTIELNWDELPPANSFHVLFTVESSPATEDLFSARYKIWDAKKLIDKYGL